MSQLPLELGLSFNGGDILFQLLAMLILSASEEIRFRAAIKHNETA